MPNSAPQLFRNRTCGGMGESGSDIFDHRYCMMYRMAEWMGLVEGGPCPRANRRNSRTPMSSEEAYAFLGKVRASEESSAAMRAAEQHGSYEGSAEAPLDTCSKNVSEVAESREQPDPGDGDMPNTSS
ncbi:hypothetical protein FOZ63_012915 [Perkinsus olseni]|uniref:Uncharacterized protein n=1 Tax=Perkinsus olseni TaxID=32597 RepID=A0A7J6TTS7_PEROL|nr:hypothetical protein FOZ63_012915 [Perkinsus olseni]KAF4748032.1 hypothetical protein FOZ62_032335 [Perkinsus olseni]